MSTPNTHFGADGIAALLQNCRSIFFLGIGGINVSSLARMSRTLGYRVGGSDRAVSPITEQLEKDGIPVFHTHDAANLDGFDAVVYTVAIAPDNPEYARARELGLPCISRADYMGYLMTAYGTRIGVSGMHGKSSCTSLCAQIFIDAETDPTVLSGAEMTLMGGACRIGGKEHFLFEACEYMDSFLDFNPTVAVILNIEMDHVDYFHSIEQIRDSFAAFADRTGPDGTVIANWDDENVCLALQNYRGRIVTFSLNDPTAEFSVRDLTTVQGHPHFTVLHRGEPLLETTMAVFGSFHAYNALAATAAATLCGIPPHKIAASLARFPGAKRRMELLGQVNGAPVYDDYAHHPTEVAATVRAMRPAAQGRLVTLFQPHTYSRTRELWNEYRTAFYSADEILLLDVYAAREQPDPVVDLERLADEINGLEGRACARHWSDYGEVAAHLTETLQPGDLCVVMGAGNVFRLYPMLPLQEVCQ